MMNKRAYVVIGYLILASLLAACGGAIPEGPFVWIEVPVNGLHVPLGAPVQVEGHAGHGEGISQVEIWVNGTLDGVVPSPPYADGLAHFVYHFTPESTGEYQIQAVAFDPDGQASQPDSTRVFAGEQLATGPDLAVARVSALTLGELDGIAMCATQVELTNVGDAPVGADFQVEFLLDGITETPITHSGGLAIGASVEITATTTYTETHEIGVMLDATDEINEADEDNNQVTRTLTCGQADPGDGPTPTPVDEAAGRFWAEPAEVQAGECTMLYWEYANVASVIFGGIEQELQGEYRTCLCEDERYTLTVIHLDDREEKFPLDISVSGVCATPTPVDTTPPPAPSPQVPANGLTLSCRSFQDLSWTPVSDPSGISEYQVQVERHSGDNNWTAIPGSTFTGIGGKTLNIAVDCGWYYRWRVRAIDSASNTGPWSSWSTFIDSLG